MKPSSRCLALLGVIIAPLLALCPAVASGATITVTVGPNHHFRMVATNTGGTRMGSDRTFTTQ